MQEYEEIIWLDKEIGCKPLSWIRKKIESDGNMHLYDALYPEEEKNGRVKVVVKYIANHRYNLGSLKELREKAELLDYRRID